jgi:hypothetical protein
MAKGNARAARMAANRTMSCEGACSWDGPRQRIQHRPKQKTDLKLTREKAEAGQIPL